MAHDGHAEDIVMAQKIPKEKILDLLERSGCGIMSVEQAAYWLPVICEYTLELIREKESREKMMDLVKKVDQFKKAREK